MQLLGMRRVNLCKYYSYSFAFQSPPLLTTSPQTPFFALLTQSDVMTCHKNQSLRFLILHSPVECSLTLGGSPVWRKLLDTSVFTWIQCQQMMLLISKRLLILIVTVIITTATTATTWGANKQKNCSNNTHRNASDQETGCIAKLWRKAIGMQQTQPCSKFFFHLLSHFNCKFIWIIRISCNQIETKLCTSKSLQQANATFRSPHELDMTKYRVDNCINL